MNQEEINSCKELHNDIDACITALIKARTEHNQEDEGKALFRMEGLMVAAQQQLAYFIDKPVPSDVQEAADWYIGHRAEVGEDSETFAKRKAFAAGMLAERERLMKGAVDGTVKGDRVIRDRYAVFAEVDPKKFRPGERVYVIIIKEKEK